MKGRQEYGGGITVELQEEVEEIEETKITKRTFHVSMVQVMVVDVVSINIWYRTSILFVAL